MGFWAALKALFELLVLAKDLLKLYQEAKEKGWIEEGRKLTEQIKGAKTDEERKELVRRLAGHNAALP